MQEKTDERGKKPIRVRCRQWHWHVGPEDAKNCDRNHWVDLLSEQGMTRSEAQKQVSSYYQHKYDPPKPAVNEQLGLFQ